MKKILSFLTISLVSLLSAQGANTPSGSIPFELGSASRIYVKGSVNGSRPLRFLFDTGATSMVISTNSLKGVPMEFNETVVNHGATGSDEVRGSTENQFTIGEQAMEHVPFIAIPYSPDQWDGVLGLWFIQRQVTEVNYTDRKIYLYPHGSYTPPANAIRLKIEYVMGVPVVLAQVTVNGKTHQLRLSVDTGSDRVLDLNTPFVKKHHLLGSQKHFQFGFPYRGSGKRHVRQHPTGRLQASAHPRRLLHRHQRYSEHRGNGRRHGQQPAETVQHGL